MTERPLAIVTLNLFQGPVMALALIAGLPAVAVAAPAAPTVVSHACPMSLVINAAAFSRQRSVANRTIENFVAAYRAACSKGLFRNRQLIQPGSVPPGTLFLKNAPEANIASIYNERGESDRLGRMVLEYPFIAHDGAVSVPSADELEEAIFCAVVGVTSEEDEGRCLPD
jgi:hypothetical protein